MRSTRLLLFALCALLLAAVLYRFYDVRPTPDAPAPARREASAPLDELERSADLGATAPGSGALDAGGETSRAPGEEALAETRLPLELLGTMAAEPAHLSTAVIRDSRARKQWVVEVGDPIEGYGDVFVFAIEPRRVLLRNGARLEVLLVHRSAYRSQSSEELAASTVGAAAGASKDGRSRGPARWETRSSSEEIAGDARSARAYEEGHEAERAREAEEARSSDGFQPVYDEKGAISGLAVPVSEGGEATQMGFENHDVITHVNGFDFADPATLTEVVTAMVNRGDLSIQIERGGEPLTMEVPASEIGRQLIDGWSQRTR